MAVSIGKIMIPLTIILCIWLAFEVIEFFRLGGASQPLAWCIVKISVITSTIIGISSERTLQNPINIELLLERFQSLRIEENQLQTK